MSREIKFRVYDQTSEDYKVYGIGEIVKEHFGLGTISRIVWWLKDIKHKFIIEQCTGLKDQNGKEIYEGDIFRNAINSGTWRVYWNEKDVAFWVDSGVAGCSLGEFDWDSSKRKYGFIRENCEVIGNVHENKESLGDEE